MIFRPRIARTGWPALELDLPMLPWAYASAGVGGTSVSAAGVPETYTIRTDRTVDVTLRVLEDELDALLSELEAIRAGAAPFAFRFDADDPLTEHTVYLDAPALPDPIRPQRDDEYRAAFRVTLTLRTTDGAPFRTPWAAAAGEEGS